MRRSLLTGWLVLTISACGVRSDDQDTNRVAPRAADNTGPALSIMQSMITEIAPATDTLWGVDEPQTDTDWQRLMAAADLTIDAFERAKTGGSGPNDTAWASEEKWQHYCDEVIRAARSAKAAIAERDLDALWVANDALYPPCEACHIDYHPGVKAAE